MNKLLNEGKDVTFLDIETTGFSPHTNRLLEVAVIRTSNFPHGKSEAFTTFVRNEYVPTKITEITNITAEMTLDAPEQEEVVAELNKFLAGTEVVIGHNVDAFDLVFLEGVGVEIPNIGTFDTLAASRALYPDLESHTLGAMIEFLELDEDANPNHRALDDVIANIMLYNEIAQYRPDHLSETLVARQRALQELQEEVDSLSYQVYNQLRTRKSKAQLVSTGEILQFDPPKKKSTFDTAKFQKVYKGDLSIFKKDTTKFDKDLVKAFDTALYDEYVKHTETAPQLRSIKTSNK